MPFWVKQQEFRPGVGPTYRYLYPSAYVSVYAEARWLWGHAPPPRKFFEFNTVRWLLRLFWGPKHHYYLLLLCWHGNKILIHFTFACMEVSIHRRFQSPGEPREGATHPSRSEFCLLFSLIVFRATPVENVWPPRSKSVLSQVSAALWPVAFVRAWICTDDGAGFLPAGKGSAQSKHWSGGCRVCRTCSAAPGVGVTVFETIKRSHNLRAWLRFAPIRGAGNFF